MKRYAIIVGQFVAGLILSGTLYLILKEPIKKIALDVFPGDAIVLSSTEPIAFTILVLLGAFSFVVWLRVAAWLRADSPKISNEVTSRTYSREDLVKIEGYYASTIAKAQRKRKRPEQYVTLSKRYPKSIYAITGGWMAGKTTASAILLNVLRDKLEVKSETYHDTFNFGNVDESISTFFGVLARKTGISQFAALGKVSTPQFDMKFEVGPLSINRSMVGILSPNKIRSKIYKKLTKSKGVHIVIIDDIDRLLPEEQIQWLRVIEVLGKFYARLIVIVPIHLGQVMENLADAGINRKYLEKILPNRLRIGVDIDFIERQFGMKKEPAQDLKRLYTKYLFNLAMRMAILKVSSGEIKSRSEWDNDFDAGNFSLIARAFKEGLAYTQNHEDNSRGTPYERITPDRELWSSGGVEYQQMESVRLAARSFLGTTDSNIEVGRVDYNGLRSIYSLKEIFSDHSVFIGDRFSRPDFDNINGQPNFWVEYAWKAIAEVREDPHLSEYFKYDQLTDEIAQLLKASSVDQEMENEVLHQFILRMD